MNVCACVGAHAQTDTIRYVHPNGSYENDGMTWATAKNRVQDAINDMHSYMEKHSLSRGYVYIAAGTYVPTESTESAGGSMLNTSFKIYEGIQVYGGFNPEAPEEKPGDRIMSNGKKCSENWSDPNGIGTTSGTEIASQWDLRHKTILTGNHSTSIVSYVFDPIRGRYNTAYPANSYHVVWFATNGKYDTDKTADELKDHFRPLDKPALLDGCVISSGNASSRSTTVREHTAYGGGVYMVGNSYLKNCIIERCNATLRGGGIYADGGGVIEFCYIHTCQSAGVGVYQGYGGGVCIDYEGSIGHSHIQNCAARCGGGLYISHVPEEYPTTGVTEIDNISNYSPFATACVISNNTANAEAGGIYLAEGGTVNHCTVCANNCMGPDVTYYGRRHGRTGGIYVRNCGQIFNSVFWGNRCDVNNDIQFASVRQKTGVAGYETFVYHTAFMNHDITDWTGVRKEAVYSLDKENMPTEGSSSNHPCFFNPSVNPNNWDYINVEERFYGAGVITAFARTVDLPGPRIWHLTSYSALDQKGVQWNETMVDLSPWLIHAHTDYGVVSNPYEPASTLGALVRKPDPIVYALVPQQGLEGRLGGDRIPTIFIDPNRPGVFEDGVFVPQEQEGNSWDTPIRDLGEGVQYFRQRFVDTIPTNRYYRLPKLDGDGKPTGEDTIFHTVQILVKEGTCRTVGPGNYVQRNIRSAAIIAYGHMRFYGGYPSSLTGTDTEGRNPRNYRSTVRCNVTGEDGNLGYENNSAHTFALVNADSVVIDGFMLQDANTHGVVSATAANDGGGIVVNNSTINPKYRVNMVYNQVRNCVISNCCSPKGAGIYVNAEWPKANGDTCYSELKIINTVIRNCKAADALATETTNNGGIVTANGRSFIHLDHCNIMNNVGIPFRTNNRRTDNTAMGYHGYIRVDNSMIYCNADRKYDMYTDIPDNSALSVNDEGDSFIYGTYNMFDADLYVPVGHDVANHPEGFFRSDYTVPTIIAGFVPDGVDSELEDDEGTAPSRTNKKNLTRINTDANYPSFVNPSRIIGNSPTGDKALYGGTVSYTPMTTNPCVNAAGNTYTSNDNFDRSDVIVRNCGGEPDVGAIENTDLPAAGTVIYVTPDGAGKRDGSSWSNAIAGNTVYRLYGAPAAEGDSVDIASDARLINKSTGAPVTTEDTRYCGGFALRYIYPKFSDSGRNIARNLEINNYVGGDNPRLDTISIDTTSNTLMSVVRYNNGPFPYDFVSSLAPDPNYPYGEMSGASRGMMRAAYNYSYFNEDGSSVVFSGDPTNPGTSKAAAEQVAATGRVVIRNERIENYVSGLQYAVEQASMRNKTLHKDTVQVWVGAGKYTDYKGFIMRDSVSVYGGFPAAKFSAPGMDERKALMSNVVAIPKSAENASLDATDYETILQISDVNPRKSDTEINPAAIKFKDDSTSVEYNITNNVSNFTDHNTVNYYRWVAGTVDMDRTSTYLQYPDITAGGGNITNNSNYHDDGVTAGVHYKHFGTAGDLDCWHMSYPDKENYIANIENGTWNNNAAKNIYNPTTGAQLTGDDASYTGNWIMLGNGSLANLNLWQTMPNVAAGEYKLSIDMSCSYKNSPSTTTGLNMTLQILDASDNVLASEPLKSFGGTKDGNRGKAYRHIISFTNASAGNITIKLVIGEGNRNTTANKATYGTPSGIDPDPIPCEYVYNGKNCTGSAWGGNNPNTREFWLSNVKLYQVVEGDGEYVLDHTETEDVTSKTINSTTVTEGTVTKKSRTTLRKRVLQMPDVTSPVYGNGLGNTVNSRGKIGDQMSHHERVIKEGRQSNLKSGGTVNGRHQDPNYKEYNNVYWDGFTIRHGFIRDEHMAHSGGAGVQLFEGGHLVNCIVTNNFVGCRGAKGAGVFCDGSNSTIENCFILNNTLTKGSYEEISQMQGGGLFLYEGTCFNSLIANNYSRGPGGGLALCVGKFYNNTLAYNTSSNDVGGLRIATGATPAIFMANTIIYGNNGYAISITTNNAGGGDVLIAPFINCYIQSVKKITDTKFTNAMYSHVDGVTDGYYGLKNTLLNGESPSAINTPFAADIVNGTYNPSNPGAKVNNDFSLRQKEGVTCINAGEEDFEGAMYKAVRAFLQRKNASLDPSDSNIKNELFYKNVVGVKLPSNDVVYAKRVQDCQVDIGAYEYNAAYAIKPDTTTHPGKAIFYVTFDAPGGDASATSPENAACRQKLQLVLDAAGRYKYSLMTKACYDTVTSIRSGWPSNDWTVEVWLEGDSVKSKTEDTYYANYTPTRSTKHNVPGYHDNTLDYSFIVPHGVQLKGGYTVNFYHYENAAGDTVDAGPGTHIVDDRDPLTFRTVLSGNIVSSTGAAGQTFHVVSFTEDLFDPNENYYMEDIGGDAKEAIRNQLAILTDEKDRAVLDGLFIMDGHANSSDPEDQIGAGAVVTDFAHVRNCVVQKNTALDKGGGLYLKPFALVSGTIIKKNSAATGGGMYIEAPASHNPDSLARIFTTTICENSATTSAGGMWFENTYARVNSTALWHNEANDNANVSGSFTRSDVNTDYPFNFCAVESRRLEGQGNVELSPKETEGVRWDRQDPFNAILYYPIEMSSTLSRAGMTYREWKKMMGIYTTLDSIDIAGVCRMGWTSDGSERGYAWGSDTLVSKKNDFIEIGARAINKNFAINVDMKYVMNRLYVMHTDLINSKAARDLQDNILKNDTANMYRQMGSCILNPFHRLGDAFDYIIAARKANPATYRNRVFEVFIEQGTYYPYHNAYGEQDEVRNNTFLIPEAVYVIGGVDSRPEDHHYGQEGYFDMFTGAAYGTTDNVTVRVMLPSFEDTSYVINSAPLDTIRLRDDRHRPMRDHNLNSVIEPWELERQTILSGNAVSGEDFTHVYHVITMHADSTHVGQQPLKFRHMNPEFDKNNLRPGIPMLADPIPMDSVDHYYQELDQSILGRTTEFDGIQITGGYANHLDPKDTVMHHYVKKTYSRGGGIFVDGNWTESFDEGSELPNVTAPAKYNIPIVVENCIFTNNMAGNGGGLYSNGGIYMFGCHFTQNYSQGPMTELDQEFIPWTAGGCIATNAVCDVSNTLFDNNEARRGMYPLNVKNKEEDIPYADARQGFAGVISAATESYLRVLNCHFMKNKAVAYPAIYNFTPNNEYEDDAKEKQFAFNTIFWGNEVFEVENLDDIYEDDAPVPVESEKAFDERYKGSRKGVFHYAPEAWNRYEQLFHNYDSTYMYWAAKGDTFNTAVTDTLMKLRAQGDLVEGLYFCSYRKTYGPTGMKPSADGYLLTQAEQRAFVDPRQKPVRLETVNGTPVERYDSLFTYVHGNNNTLINRINNATDGPNFKQPTYVAGIDGYMQNADWVLARMNLTTDQGWGHLKQTVKRDTAYYITKWTGAAHFATRELAKEALDTVTVGTPDKSKDIYPVTGLPVAEFDDVQHPYGAIYNWYSKRYGTYMSEVNAPLPLKDQYYMAYTRSTSEDEMSGNMERISRHPRLRETDVYIDVGIYEYQYAQLDIKGRDIDTMWVATKAKDPFRQDGLTWETPTTDLQTAIDRLMSSHNNHDKYVCFMGDAEGTFSPANVIDNRRAFIITSNTLEPLMPDSALADYDYGVNSLTFLGGYSFDVKDAPRDPQANPVVIEMPNTGVESQRNQLFIVEDMTRQMTQLNWLGEYTSRDSVVIPIVFDGITFINPYSTKDPSSDEGGYNNQGGLMSKKGGAAIYYRWQRRYEGGDGGSTATPNFNMALHPDSALIDGRKVTLPKLTVSNCIFMDNGERTTNHNERSAAVRIDHGAGSSLFVNTLFHSNAGAPIYAKTFDVVEGDNDLASVPNDVFIINCTSALNDGHIHLEGENSEVHNSLIWLDDLDNDTTIQLQMGASDQWDKTDANNDRQGIGGRMTHNAVWGCFVSHDGNDDPGDTCFNHPLSTANNNIYQGPGFVQPYVSASTSEQRRSRSFRLNPSVRTIGKADTTIYRDRVFFRVYPDTCAETHNKYWRRSNGFKSAYIVALANDFDMASKPRLSGPGLDRGAYECLAVLQRVLYVDPSQPAFSAGDGSSWAKAFGQGQLQNAIDAASVYTYLAQGEPHRASRKAYVFVRGSDYKDHRIDARDGVSVFGSLPTGFFDMADSTLNETTGKYEFTDAECQRFVNYVRAYNSGVASPDNITPTRISSIHVEGGDDADAFTTGFLLENFVIDNTGLASTVPAVRINNDSSAIRNCVIINTRMGEGGEPVAEIDNGLLYNCLFYGDSASAIVKVGAKGLALNNTIVTNCEGVVPLDTTEARPRAAVNNIALNSTTDALDCFAPYMTDNNPYALPAFISAYPALAYQLHEHSALINAGTDDSALPAIFDRYVADSTIAFRYDRDVLGNPRKISTGVEIGALETWRVEKGNAQEITALTNEVPGSSSSVSEKNAAFLEHYGGNSYPHGGSVVYLMDSAVMTMQYETANDFKDLKGSTIYLRPGFLLLKPGASFYGNGHTVQLSYVAAEKRFQEQRYAMTAMPFKYSADNITVTAYDADKDSLGHILSPFTFNTYQYAGAARSAKDYVFQTENSTLWQKIDTLNRTATDGYLMDFGEARDTVLRFNAFSTVAGQYIYTEGEDADGDGYADDKTIELVQHDNRTPGIGEELNFTRQEDMGWNMKGLPWLVTNYRTDTIIWADNYLRQMYIPHVLYQMNGAGEYIKQGDNIYTSRSWDRGSIVSIGNAFFTQTATTQASEEVIFHLPLYSRNEKASRPLLRILSRPRPAPAPMRREMKAEDGTREYSDLLTIIPDSTASKRVEYVFGRDGLKWMSNEPTAQVYLFDAQRSSRISLLGAAPTDVDIPLGVKMPADEEAMPLFFSLPEKEAFADYDYVWLIDYKHNRYTNLKNADYETEVAGECNDRFAVRIGKFPKTDGSGRRQYVVYTYDGNLYVRGLIEGDKITVYSTTGQLVHQAIATGTEYKTPLVLQTGYVVKVNDVAHKVMNM